MIIVLANFRSLQQFVNNALKDNNGLTDDGVRTLATMIVSVADSLPTAVARIEALERELHDAKVRRDEWERMYHQAVTDASAHIEALGAALRPLLHFMENPEEWKCSIVRHADHDDFAIAMHLMKEDARAVLRRQGAEASTDEGGE